MDKEKLNRIMYKMLACLVLFFFFTYMYVWLPLESEKTLIDFGEADIFWYSVYMIGFIIVIAIFPRKDKHAYI